MKTATLMQKMDARARDIFRQIVETYLDTGSPIGSRTLARAGSGLSPASIRNVMSDLTELGLLDAVHVSAGRFPTHQGLRLFIDGFMESATPSDMDKALVKTHLSASAGDVPTLLKEASGFLSGLAGGAGLVASPKRDTPVRHVEFVPLSTGEALCVLVTADGDVENRLMDIPAGLPVTTLIEAGNYLSARMAGRTLYEAKAEILNELTAHKAQLDNAAANLVRQGLAHWAGKQGDGERALIIQGRANLLENAQAAEDVERVREIFEAMDRQKSLLDLLESTHEAAGVRLFIGAENALFPNSGSSVIIAPYMNHSKTVIGALGVIAPTRLNYARIIPMVDYTAKILGRLVGEANSKT